MHFGNKKELNISERKAEVNYKNYKIFRFKIRISLPIFPFEFSVEEASNRVIDNTIGLIKVLEHSTFIYLLTLKIQTYERI